MTSTAEKSTGEADDRYGAFETGNGDLVVYDRENPEAWVQASNAIALGNRENEPTASSD
jgi:hypothetical protein